MPRLRTIGLLASGILLLALAAPASAQNAPTRDDIVAKLDKYQSDLELVQVTTVAREEVQVVRAAAPRVRTIGRDLAL